MKIVRTMPDEGWVPIANSAARDHAISWRARGLLAELLSYPDGWDTNIDQLVRKAKAEGGNAEGRDAMLKAMAELVTAGYVKYIRSRGADRRIMTLISVTDDPSRHTDVQCVGEPVGRDSSVSAGQCAGDQSVLINTDTETDTKKDLSKETDQQYSESLTSFAVAAAASTAHESQEQTLERIYSQIDQLGETAWRQHLLTVERRRPKIYREARNEAIKQLKTNEPKTLTSDAGARIIDRLSYKWIALHYIDETGELPIWFARPMGWTG